MPSRYYKILLPILLFAAAGILCVGVGYRTLHEQTPTSPLALTPTSTTNANVHTSTTSSAVTNETSSGKSALFQSHTSSTSLTTSTTTVPSGYIQATITVPGSNYSIAVPPQSTVEDAMKLLEAQNSTFTFTQKSFPSLGEFVESINGHANANGYYWFLYVNGKSSDTGISETIIQPGDEIQWQYKNQSLFTF